ncbi:MAG: ABC transporter ATP-binding protein/permease [Fusobacterium mortiferum]|jgi:ATP-binding cassette subfamily B multidrug efflux pump|uniref:ABC transporter ATP-binding protein n=2 Tax=Fusobacterium mortiferum TaxID=850 RepID=A0A414PQI4_FUSMR|nr:ABC transporter ATP-binding protein [Fusobacterium mortiferum]AVQ17731.1 ABC transporter ATP-binding protein [Fusobacterium mortiferum ATCC 9817]EEO36585.1 ABC transporter, ATP-binding protein [Fusobacterium mortiferum ATCC 9817]MCI6382133.1 ABC transporter ATP-binding protein/permease [Fusobacterium mortiferum]MCI7187432.1 ABC transporter ATP-binding protein/permease [Fusobacterium mortiferum]MDD7261909.1 ABC transporter ATP-binding protein [Fusobacterium mortiferum]
MFKYFKPYIPRGIIAALFKMGESFADLTLPLIMAKVIDIGVSNKDFEYILSMGGKMILVAGAGYLSAILSNYFSSRTSQEFGANLRESIFTKIQHFTFNQLNKFSQASLITRITKDVDQVTNMFLMCIRMVLRGLTTGIGAVIMAIIINPTLSIIFIIITPLIIYSTLYYMKKSFGLFDLVQKKLDNLTLILRENLSGIRVVRALSKEKIEESRFDKKNDELKEQSIKAESLMISKLPFITLIMNLGVVAVLWFGGINVHYGNMHLGEIVAFINYLNMILFAMNALSFLFTLYSKTSISYKRIKEIVGENIEVVEQEEFEKNLSDNILEFNHVYFSYDKSDRYVLEDIDFKIKRGESIGVIGGIGSGKSTLVSLIPRFFDVVKGEIKIDGVNIKRYQESELRGKIGLVLQKAFLFSQSIRENIMWGNQYATQEDIELVAHISQGKEFIEKFPEKYETELIKGGNNLSGGQKQRVSIARTLLKQPEILIFDDSFSALDFITEHKLKEELKTYMKTVTTITISPKISSLIKMDRIIVMDNGKIAGFDTHENLIKNCSVYREICESQEICTTEVCNYE